MSGHIAPGSGSWKSLIFSRSRKRFVRLCIKVEKKFNTTRLSPWPRRLEEFYMDAQTLPSIRNLD